MKVGYTMSNDKKEEFDMNEAIDKVFKDSKEKEILFCPRCNNTLMIQRSRDWSKLYAAYCPKCEFGVKFTYKLT